MMEITITKKEHQQLLHRTDVEARLAYAGVTPTRKEIVAGVAKATGAAKELVIVRTVAARYSQRSATVSAFVYDNRKALEALETKSRIRKSTFDGKEGAKTDAQDSETKSEGDT
jgi:ribosomal protein S24E